MIEFKSLPKIELHVHLDGSLRPLTISKNLNMDLDKVTDSVCVNENIHSLKDYLSTFKLPVLSLQSKKNLMNAAKELALDLKDDGVIYAEVRFAPLKHSDKIWLRSVIKSVIKGSKQVPDIKINYILCMMRNDSFKDNLKVIKVAKSFLNKGVCAVDLAGDEYTYKTSSFSRLFEEVNKRKVPFTIHAGEADDYTSVLAALSFGAKRIGHGIRSIENDTALDLIKKNNVYLEICPKSNLDTNMYLDYQHHPVKKLFDQGIKVTINTDNRTTSNITLSKEYENLYRYLGFNLNNFIEVNHNAIAAAFLNKKEKLKLQSEFDNILLNKKK